MARNLHRYIPSHKTVIRVYIFRFTNDTFWDTEFLTVNLSIINVSTINEFLCCRIYVLMHLSLIKKSKKKNIVYSLNRSAEVILHTKCLNQYKAAKRNSQFTRISRCQMTKPNKQKRCKKHALQTCWWDLLIVRAQLDVSSRLFLRSFLIGGSYLHNKISLVVIFGLLCPQAFYLTLKELTIQKQHHPLQFISS